ncbi:sulfur oxidation c-type cytochrome SoxA [Ponticoccus sp. SC2-23]|nr:sulfur oxidation c-type cytochrome SoxA [Ponticoccus sp. SC6-9]MBM1225575.1 sulfur oxidation c-type cytochrome SoxA [Ponticoccus sp. SC6-15]MBM1227727.1 sulfur oxidation c-type cytochrome SoxA [Ponticoccus sp. SC6-38]MBM1234635.1 sulfur oxidation c-type cytochrome SoxA [Ponticoccus sp. SC6-45]MBM1238229.1 sulfur oxidation c-type cytochrome SoxA [Ponticoccus sp. SC6-49]MBM1243498.1 sulfur oxidation c-type cytochrome SoxA [Ponticoccus sp. SC2-64]MBM1248159.1 sulfur oxidation c-type cytochrom
MRRAAILACLIALPALADDRVTGFEQMSSDLQMMQNDPFANPGQFWVLDGQTLWSADPGTGAESCAGCHGDASATMVGVAARYPAWDNQSNRPVDLEGRIELCRTEHQNAEPFGRESAGLLALSAFLTHQSKGLPITRPEDPRLAPWLVRGETLFTSRMGQLNLSCAICHDDNAGNYLAAALIPEAHPTGYPQYRLEWQTMGSLSRRFGNCLFGVRATSFAAGSDEYIALELYLKARAAGLAVESPAVRP